MYIVDLQIILLQIDNIISLFCFLNIVMRCMLCKMFRIAEYGAVRRTVHNLCTVYINCLLRIYYIEQWAKRFSVVSRYPDRPIFSLSVAVTGMDKDGF